MERGFWFNKDKYFAQTRKNIPRNLGAGRVRLFSVAGFPLLADAEDVARAAAVFGESPKRPSSARRAGSP